jgi:NADH:ubiquinone reductase (H+-translocating)
MTDHAKHILVLGAGFGGLTFGQTFRHPKARVTLVDAQNHHLFQPLLYQVAAAGLSAPEIAEPVRSILSRRRQVTVLMDTATDIDLPARTVQCQAHTLSYDYLVVALGCVTSYFGHPEWAEFAPGLKSLDDALRIRRDLLLAFERAENETDPVVRRRLMTIVVVGGGATGVELAGAFAELARHVLRRDFRRIDPSQARVILIEAGPRLLPQMSERLSASALRQLERFCVEVRLNTKVADIRRGEVQLEGGQVLAADNIVWAAGVAANPLSARLGVERDRMGRVRVLADLSLPGRTEVFVIGDLASVTDARGRPVPGVSPAAMQMARHVARIVERDLDAPASTPSARPPFCYRDKGTMATIGRSAAVAKVGRLEFSGFLAWLAWLFVHLVFLIGFDNKLTVLIQWAHSYLTYKRGARIIVQSAEGLPAFKGQAPGLAGKLDRSLRG